MSGPRDVDDVESREYHVLEKIYSLANRYVIFLEAGWLITYFRVPPREAGSGTRQ